MHRSSKVTMKACTPGLRCLAQFTQSEGAPWYLVEVLRTVPGGMGASDKAKLRVLARSSIHCRTPTIASRKIRKKNVNGEN